MSLNEALKEVIEPSNSLTPALARSVSGVTYTLAPNPLNLRTLRLDFNRGKEALATLGFDETRWIARVGLDGKRRFAPGGPHGLALASAGRWLSESEAVTITSGCAPGSACTPTRRPTATVRAR